MSADTGVVFSFFLPSLWTVMQETCGTERGDDMSYLCPHQSPGFNHKMHQLLFLLPHPPQKCCSDTSSYTKPLEKVGSTEFQIDELLKTIIKRKRYLLTQVLGTIIGKR